MNDHDTGSYDRYGARLIDSAAFPLDQYSGPELLEMIMDASVQRGELIEDGRDNQAQRVEAFILRLRAQILGRLRD